MICIRCNRIIRLDDKVGGEYFPTISSIIVGTFSNRNRDAALILSHELGHHIADTKMPIKNKSESDCAFRDYFNHFALTKKQKSIIMNEEKIAWKRARYMLKKFGYKDWKRYNKYKKKCLNEYKRDLKID